MKILKFGGTSVGTAISIQYVKSIIGDQEGGKIVVLSAMSGVTNLLVEISDNFRKGKFSEVESAVENLELKHLNLINELITAQHIQNTVRDKISVLFSGLISLTHKDFSENLVPEILPFGETVLTNIFSAYLTASGVSNILLNSKKFMYVSNMENPDTDKVGRFIAPFLRSDEENPVYITQGFVCVDKFNRINTLKRGGSDFTATILGAAIKAEEVQIWTDIDGFRNNDPRYVEKTHRLSYLTFEETAELAYFGAKILHPNTVSPVIQKNIPLFLKNTFTPEAPGTKIYLEVIKRGLKAISAKDGITAIKIKYSPDDLLRWKYQ